MATKVRELKGIFGLILALIINIFSTQYRLTNIHNSFHKLILNKLFCLSFYKTVSYNKTFKF